jgi:hypothetical protein
MAAGNAPDAGGFVEHDERLVLADGSVFACSLTGACELPSRAPVVLIHGLASNRTR